MKDKVIVKDLRSALAASASVTTLASILQDVGVTEQQELHIDNKYYHATLRCVLQEGEAAHEEQLPQEHEFDAALLVVDTLETHASHHITTHLSALSDRSVSILIVADASPTASSHQERVRSICLEHNAEYTILNTAPAESEPTKDGPFQDVDGAARIREALEAHMWPHLEMKIPTGMQHQPHSASDKQQSQQRQQAEADKQEEGEGSKEKGETQAGERGLRSVENGHADSGAEGAPADQEDALLNSLLQSLSTIGSENFADDDDLEGDQDAFNLLELSTLMREIRETGPSMPEEQRRGRAAQVALTMARMLDDGDNSEDDAKGNGEDKHGQQERDN